MTSSRWARDNSWYGNVSGGELKSPQMMTAQSDTDCWLLLLSGGGDDDDDVDCTKCSSSLTANDACSHMTYQLIICTTLVSIAYYYIRYALSPRVDSKYHQGNFNSCQCCWVRRLRSISYASSLYIGNIRRVIVLILGRWQKIYLFRQQWTLSGYPVLLWRFCNSEDWVTNVRVYVVQWPKINHRLILDVM